MAKSKKVYKTKTKPKTKSRKVVRKSPKTKSKKVVRKSRKSPKTKNKKSPKGFYEDSIIFENNLKAIRHKFSQQYPNRRFSSIEGLNTNLDNAGYLTEFKRYYVDTHHTLDQTIKHMKGSNQNDWGSGSSVGFGY